LFYFKLLDEQGSTLLQSRGFQTPQEAGRVIGEMQQLPHDFAKSFSDRLEPVDNEIALAASKVLEALAKATAGD
jgi:tryptophanyl-tRNA synthetase